MTTVPGLYFLGLPWLYTWGSGRFSGIARDATFVVDHIAAEAGGPPPAVPGPAAPGSAGRAEPAGPVPLTARTT